MLVKVLFMTLPLSIDIFFNSAIKFSIIIMVVMFDKLICIKN